MTHNGAERIFVDEASGTNRVNRPKLTEALPFVRDGDTLVITRLDRFARSVPDLHAIVKELHARKYVGAGEVKFTSEEIAELNAAVAAIKIEGGRLPDAVLAYSGVEAPEAS